jgi:hypothetical protein
MRERMPSAEAVRIRRKDGIIITDCDVYIGRAMYQGGWRLPASKWANPFKVIGKTPQARQNALVQYEAYVRAAPALMASLPELRGKRLGCFCSPSPCHADVLIKLLRELDPPPVAKTAEEILTTLPPYDDPIWDDLHV